MRAAKQPTEFGSWLTARLKSRGINPQRLAELTNVHASRVSKWIYANRPSVASCDLIAQALVIPLNDVLEAAGYPIANTVEPSGDLRAEIARLAEVIPEPLLLPYVIGMRAMVSHREPSLLLEEMRERLAEMDDEGSDGD